jgi:hypothetical protein
LLILSVESTLNSAECTLWIMLLTSRGRYFYCGGQWIRSSPRSSFERLKANAKVATKNVSMVATVLGSIPASLDTVEFAPAKDCSTYQYFKNWSHEFSFEKYCAIVLHLKTATPMFFTGKKWRYCSALEKNVIIVLHRKKGDAIVLHWKKMLPLLCTIKKMAPLFFTGKRPRQFLHWKKDCAIVLHWKKDGAIVLH